MSPDPSPYPPTMADDNSIIDPEACNTTLGLEISLDDFVPKSDLHHHHHQQQKKKKKKKQNLRKPVLFFDLSFPFHHHHFKDEQDMEMEISGLKKEEAAGSSSKISMNNYNGEEEEDQKVQIISVSNNNNESGVRKKLRLTKEQSTLLENSFKQHSTPNMIEKQTLAEKLNLKPRQVEVWFQNRRARTKLKQTEVDCEFLKKCCENLSNENRRLKREVQELRSRSSSIFKNINKLTTTPAKPLFLELHKANYNNAAATNNKYSVCSSCQKTMIRSPGDGATGGGADDVVKG